MDDGDEQRDAHLATNVGEDLPLGLRMHALAPCVVALALFAREQEGQDEEDVDGVLGEVSIRVRLRLGLSLGLGLGLGLGLERGRGRGLGLGRGRGLGLVLVPR